MRMLAGFGIVLAALTAAAQSRPVRLLSEVAVQREDVRLFDLLPSGSSARVPLATDNIGLGRAPQPGSFRVFTREQLLHRIGGRSDVDIPEQVVVRRPLADSYAGKPLPHRHAVAALVDPRRPASLIVETQAIRIQMQVIPLRKAGLGETVRVFDPATRRVLVAQVAGEGLLQISGESHLTKGEKP